MSTDRPAVAFDHVLAPLLRPRHLVARKSGSFPAMAPKPALEARAAERLRRERVMADVFGRLLDRPWEHGLRASGVRIPNTEAASWFDVVETIIRGMRDRKRPITGVHLAQMPEDFAHTLIAETRKRIAINDSLPSQPEWLCSDAVLTANDHYRAP